PEGTRVDHVSLARRLPLVHLGLPAVDRAPVLVIGQRGSVRQSLGSDPLPRRALPRVGERSRLSLTYRASDRRTAHAPSCRSERHTTPSPSSSSACLSA